MFIDIYYNELVDSPTSLHDLPALMELTIDIQLHSFGENAFWKPLMSKADIVRDRSNDHIRSAGKSHKKRRKELFELDKIMLETLYTGNCAYNRMLERGGLCIKVLLRTIGDKEEAKKIIIESVTASNLGIGGYNGGANDGASTMLLVRDD